MFLDAFYRLMACDQVTMSDIIALHQACYNKVDAEFFIDTMLVMRKEYFDSQPKPKQIKGEV